MQVKFKIFLNKVLVYTFNKLFFILPFVVFFYIGMNFAANLAVGDNESNEQYKMLFGAIGINAALAGLSLRLNNSTENAFKKEHFYDCGERLVHATILFIMATILSYTLGEIRGGQLNYYFKNVITVLLFFPCIFFFWYGLIYDAQALATLHVILFKGNEKPLD